MRELDRDHELCLSLSRQLQRHAADLRVLAAVLAAVDARAGGAPDLVNLGAPAVLAWRDGTEVLITRTPRGHQLIRVEAPDLECGVPILVSRVGAVACAADRVLELQRLVARAKSGRRA